MESEDDMHDASNDVESVEDHYYSGGDDSDYYHDDADDDVDASADYDFMGDESDGSDQPIKDIRQRQVEDITTISTVLTVARETACLLLRRYNWNVSDVHEEWFADEEKVRKAVGLLDKQTVQLSNVKELILLASINDGPGCLMLRCPDPSCGQTIKSNKQKYHRYLLRSFIEDNRKTKWCPAPGCDSAVEFVVGSGNYDVSCSCSHSFCWNCTEEAHRPVDCDTVSKWIMKNSAESENMNWILANSKPCPKCKRPIEKNQGCMHMTCTPPCKFEFCWLCLGAWTDHGERTGGFYACNRYEAAKQEGGGEASWFGEIASNVQKNFNHLTRGSANDFNDFRTKLAGLTSVTRNYFENLVRALENGLADVDSQAAACSKSASAKCVAGTSKGKNGKGKVSSRKNNDDGGWACDKCTYMNVKSASICQMCSQRR
ncbi:hypothetical protein Leryth_003803 [Lithospermum erythrorhizon]|nr:hypothetical protein Leryth_003803 [Lithospermum erythrorhizon]